MDTIQKSNHCADVAMEQANVALLAQDKETSKDAFEFARSKWARFSSSLSTRREQLRQAFDVHSAH